MKTRNMHFVRHVTYLAVILGMTGCGLPDREVPVSPQMVTTLDGGSVIAPGNVLADSGSGLGDDNDAGVDGVLNDAGHTETGYVDAGEGAFGPEADGGTGITEQPCASSADCFGDAPKCDLDLLVCGACTIECGDDRYCVVDALENQSCECELGYVEDADGLCVAQCVTNDTCVDSNSPVCDSTTGLCRGCNLGECLSSQALFVTNSLVNVGTHAQNLTVTFTSTISA